MFCLCASCHIQYESALGIHYNIAFQYSACIHVCSGSMVILQHGAWPCHLAEDVRGRSGQIKAALSARKWIISR